MTLGGSLVVAVGSAGYRAMLAPNAIRRKAHQGDRWL